MVDNQHKKITGYRDLTEQEIADMNAVKLQEQQLADMVDNIMTQNDGGHYPFNPQAVHDLDIAKTHLQIAFMLIVRAIAKPVSPWR